MPPGSEHVETPHETRRDCLYTLDRDRHVRCYYRDSWVDKLFLRLATIPSRFGHWRARRENLGPSTVIPGGFSVR